MSQEKEIVSRIEYLTECCFKPGDLLAFKNKNFFGLIADTQLLRSFHEGHPDIGGDQEAMKGLNAQAPFMFLGWGAYDKEWQVQSYLGSTVYLVTHQDMVGEKRFIVGMKILFQGKVMLLTCNHLYGLKRLRETTAKENMYFTFVFLHDIVKVS